MHRKTAELGGNLRTGLEDTFYLPDGSMAKDNGELIAALVQIAKDAGRQVTLISVARVGNERVCVGV